MTVAAQLMVKVGSDISGLQRGLAQANAQIKSASGTMASNIGSAASNIGRSLTMGVTLPLVGVGAAVVATAASFDKEMRNIQSISKQTDAEIAALGDTFVQMSQDISKTTDAPENLAKAYYQVYSAGFQGAEGVKVLEAATKAASAGLTTTEQSVAAITATLNAYGMEADKAAWVSDVLFRTVDLGVITFDELSTQFGDVVSTAAALNMPLEQVGAALALITRGGVPAAEAVTSLNRFLLAFLSPSEQAKKVAAALGIELSAAHLQAVGLAGAVQEMNDKTGGSAELIQALVGDVRAFKAALNLTRGDGAAFTDMLAQFGDVAGRTDAAFAEQIKSFDAQWKNFRNIVKGLLIELGTALLPILTQIMEALKPLVKAFAALPDPVKKAIVVIGMIVAALGPLLMIVGPIISGIGAIGGAIGGLAPILGGAAAAIVAAIGAIGAPVVIIAALIIGAILAIKTNFLGFRDFLVQVGAAVAAVFEFIVTTIGAWLKNLANVVSAIWDFLTGKITFDEMISRLAASGRELVATVTGAFEDLAAKLQDIWENIKDIVKQALQDIVKLVDNTFGKLGASVEALGKYISGGFKGSLSEIYQQVLPKYMWGVDNAARAHDRLTAATGRYNAMADAQTAKVNAATTATARLTAQAKAYNAAIATAATGAGIDLNGILADSTSSGIDDALSAWENALSSFVDGARSNLERLAPEGFFGDMTAAGANGPFENIFRALDVAVNGANSQWAAQLGLDQATAARIVRDFQAGLITAEVQALIDIPMLTSMVQRQQLGQAMTQAFIQDVARAAGASKGAVMTALLPANIGQSPAVATAAGNVTTGLTTALKSGQSAATLATGGQGMMTALGQGMTQNTKPVTDAALAVAKAFADALTKNGKPVLDAGKAMVKGLTDEIAKAVKDAWGEIERQVKTSTENTKSMLTEKWTAIKTFLVATNLALRTDFETQWAAIRTFLQVTADAIKLYLTTIFTVLQGSLASINASTRNDFETQWAAIQTAVINAATTTRDEATRLIAEMAAQINTTLTDLAASAYDHGTTFMEQFIQGIKDMLPDVEDVLAWLADIIAAYVPPGGSGTTTPPSGGTTAPPNIPGGGRQPKVLMPVVASSNNRAAQPVTGVTNPITINIFNPTGKPTEESVMAALRKLAAVGILEPV